MTGIMRQPDGGFAPIDDNAIDLHNRER